jgi:hypothetical protein
LGIGADKLEVMAKKATGNGEREIGGLKKLGWRDVLSIYEMSS